MRPKNPPSMPPTTGAITAELEVWLLEVLEGALLDWGKMTGSGGNVEVMVVKMTITEPSVLVLEYEDTTIEGAGVMVVVMPAAEEGLDEVTPVEVLPGTVVVVEFESEDPGVTPAGC